MKRAVLTLLCLGLALTAGAQQYTGSSRPAGQILFFSTGQIPTGAGTTEQTLWSYTVPGGLIDTSSGGVRVTIGALTAANANQKSLRFKIGGVTITDSATTVATPNNVGYLAVLDIYRSSDTTQVITGAHTMSTTKQARATTLALSWLTDLALTITALDTVDSIGDLTVTSVLVEKLPPYTRDPLCGFNATTTQLSFEGDSQTALRPGGWDYPTQMMRALGYPICDAYAGDLGIAGSTTASMTARAAAADASIRPGKTKRILVVWIGTNDLFNGGAPATGAAVYAALVSYAQARQAAGWTVVVLTVLPTTKTGVPGSYETERLALNVLLRANFATFATALVDVTTDVRLQDSTNALYFDPDHLHLIARGYGVVAAMVQAVVQGLL